MGCDTGSICCRQPLLNYILKLKEIAFDTKSIGYVVTLSCFYDSGVPFISGPVN